MNRFVSTGLLLMLASGAVFANSAAPKKSAATKNAASCVQVRQACQSAGFVKGKAADGKNLYRDCITPIAKGQSVKGVVIEASAAKSCQQARAQRQQKVRTSHKA